MARLPVPGSDDDIWGVVLNDFLEVEHNSDGTLKIRTDGTLPSGLSGLQAISISSPTNNQVLAYDSSSSQWTNQSSSGVPDATTSTPGLIQLSGDLAGTYNSPIVVSTHLSGALTVSQGGTGDTAMSAYAIMAGGITTNGPLQQVSGLGNSGQVLTSNGTNTLPTWQNGPSGLSWNNVSGTTQAAAVNNGYIANNSSLVLVTLPSSTAIGNVIAIVGAGSGGWRLAQNSGQTVNFGNAATTTGTGGSLSSTSQYDSVEIVCVATNTTFVVRSSVGNLTVT